MFSNSIPALITPFLNDHIDYPCLDKLIEWHIDAGSSALLICGTTGEAPTLNHEEHINVLATAVRTANGRIPIIAGVGSNSTAEAIQLSQAAQDIGASALLHATGYYNKPTPQQVIGHFEMIATKTKLPILVYNIPSRTGIEFQLDTMVQLAQIDQVIGVKDSTGNITKVSLERAQIKKPFYYLSGDDGTALGYIAQGGHGAFSVTANIAPKLCAEMMRHALANDFQKALAIHDRLIPLFHTIFLEPSPSGIKYAMSRVGLCQDGVRRPLTSCSAETRLKIDQALEFANLI